MRKPSILILLLTLVFTHSVYATNGINLIGFGAESIGMGGSDLAVARDTTALNTNPSGLSQISNKSLDLYFALAHALDIRNEDAFGDNKTIDNDWAYITDAGYAQRVGDFTLGIGAFAQGGIGIVYKDLATTFGTTDELSAVFRIARITPGISWQVNNDFSVGVSLLVTYAILEQKIFPSTSFNNTVNPPQSFFGQDLDGADTINTWLKNRRPLLGKSFTPAWTGLHQQNRINTGWR